MSKLLIRSGGLGCLTAYNIMANNLQLSWEEFEQMPELERWKAFPTAPVGEFLERWIRLFERLVWMVAPTTRLWHDDRGEYFSRARDWREEDEVLGLEAGADGGRAGAYADDEEVVVSRSCCQMLNVCVNREVK